jgi:hypothetical protein
MAWAVAMNGRMHVVGGYARAARRPALPPGLRPAARRLEQRRAAAAGRQPRRRRRAGRHACIAIGGFTEQNRKPHAECFAWTAADDRWRRIAPLPQACGSVACVIGIDGALHGIGGAVGDTFDTKKSVDWHLVYDPRADRWSRAAPLPTARDHVGAVVANGIVHVIGGRVDSFHTNFSSAT